MESLERLASSIAQTELLVASLKRENRDLASRLAAAAEERHAEMQAARAALDAAAEERRAEMQASRAALEALRADLRSAAEAPKRDPAMEVRAYDAEHRAQRLEHALAEAKETHQRERSRLEALIRQLEAQVMASQVLEQLPVASADALAEAAARERDALAGLAEAQARGAILEAQVRDLQARLDALLTAEEIAAGESLALKASVEALKARSGRLEADLAERERELAGLRQGLESAESIRAERQELRREKRDALAIARERQGLKRRLEELLATLESVRL